MKIEKFVSNNIVHVVNTNADALAKVCTKLNREVKCQSCINLGLWVCSVFLLQVGALNHKQIDNLCAQNLLLAKEIDKLKAEKNTAVEETEM